MSDYIMTISIAVQAIATIALVWVTYYLVKHTKALAKISGSLAQIEVAREKRAHREKRLYDIERTYELAEAILKVDPGFFGASLFNLNSLGEGAEYLKKIELMSNQIEDSDTVQLLRELVRDIQSVEQGSSLGEENRVKAIDKFEKFQKRLQGLQMHKWREQLAGSDNL